MSIGPAKHTRNRFATGSIFVPKQMQGPVYFAQQEPGLISVL
jgi:hypothetical protein